MSSEGIFFPGSALYLIYKTLKIAWLHIQVVSSNRAPRIERLYFSSTNKDCLSSVFGRGSHLRGAGYRYTRLWKANQSITGGQWPWKFTWRSSSALLFWRCFCCASTCIFIFIYGCNSWSTHHFMRPWQTLRSSKSLFVRVFYGEKVEKEGRRELSIRDETSGDKLLKTLNKKKVVQTGIRMKDSSALRANSCNESYNETHVSEKRGNITKQCLLKRKNLIILILVQAEVDLPYLVLYWTTIRTSCTGLSPSISHYHTSNP